MKPSLANPFPGQSKRRGLPSPLPKDLIDAFLQSALEEDLGPGDVTSNNCVPAGVRAKGTLVAKDEGVLAGLDVFVRTFELCDPSVKIELLAKDGDVVKDRQHVAYLEGMGRGLLAAERTALNMVQRMSGIATVTSRFVAAAAGRARILDTRKTTPLLRVFQKYAVRCGGGENHRFGLFDEAMIKDNHLDLSGKSLDEVVREVRSAGGPDLVITAESRTEEEAANAVRGGANIVMLDNMSPTAMAEIAPRLRDLAKKFGVRIEVEASGGVNLSNVAEVAASGVDRISIGALTHSAPSMDLSLELEPLG